MNINKEKVNILYLIISVVFYILKVFDINKYLELL